MAEVIITRKQIVVVDTVGENSYKDLTFTDKEGNAYKISNKRVQYFKDKILPGRAVQLNFAKAYDKEYIYSADFVEDKLPETKAPEIATKATTSTTLAKEAIKLGAKPIPTGDDRIRSMAISYAKDLVVAGKVELKDIKAYADRFVAYILGKE